MTVSGTGPSASAFVADSSEFEVLLVVDDSVQYRYAALCPALPGCVSDGRTRDEVLEMIKEAIELYLSDLEQQQPLPAQPSPVDEVVGEYTAAGLTVETVKIRIQP